MRVDLRCRNVRVAEKFLDDPQISAPAEQMRGKTMAHQVGVNMRFNASARRVLSDELPNARRR